MNTEMTQPDAIGQAVAELAAVPLTSADFVVASDGQAEQAVTPLIAGTFALYDDTHGGFVLVTDTTQHGVMRRHIPSAMVKLAGKLASGGGLLSGMFR